MSLSTWLSGSHPGCDLLGNERARQELTAVGDSGPVRVKAAASESLQQPISRTGGDAC